MVNYHGPAAIRRLVEAMEIPIFNRVSQITHTSKDLSKIQLKKEDVARMHKLEQISVSQLSNKLVNESDFKTVKDMVPPCRMGKVARKKNHIDIEVKSGFTSACFSR